MLFDENFVYGAATAAFQIEGAAYEDGKGLSIWDVRCMEDGYVEDGTTGETACDHYHRYEEDIQLLKKLGIQAYRFSISWCRILPEGTGRVNEKGLEFYDRLIDGLAANGIEPYVTLFHWDYPYELFKKGGWLNNDSPKWFAEFTRIVVDRYSDRVKHWFTINEPSCFIGLGYRQRHHAPCLGLDLKSSLAAAHNVLLAHGMSVQVIREYAKQKPMIGFAPQGHIAYPWQDGSQELRKQDIEAAKQHMFSVRDSGLVCNTWWMDPVYKGEYPEDGRKLFERFMPQIGADDMKIISQPLDFLGMNSYGGTPVVMGADGRPQVVKRSAGSPKNASGWSLDFDALYWGAKFFHERYKLPILISENGMSANDWVSTDKAVHDVDRLDFLKRNLLALDRAHKEGIPMHGYFVWSFLDNMEWMHGYDKRFGIVFVDYETQKRTIKDSGLWYADVIRNKRID